jgi:hypothetical protein
MQVPSVGLVNKVLSEHTAPGLFSLQRQSGQDVREATDQILEQLLSNLQESCAHCPLNLGLV